MTAVAIETSVLESLDFEITCQTVYVHLYTGVELEACSKTATHTATIHKHRSCEWVEKFLCEEHAASYHDRCLDCHTAPRIKDCQHLGTHT